MTKHANMVCIHCHLAKPRTDKCELCEESVCASCVIRPTPERVQYWSSTDRPKETECKWVCPRCFDETLEPIYERYDQALEAAHNTHYFPKAYRGAPPVLRKARQPVTVDNGVDREDVLTKLQLVAVQQGFNGLIHLEIESKKQRMVDGYSKMVWRGTALPADLDTEKLERGWY
ncbi:MAG TPA: hypothetical protein PLH57_00590 [Oligoflexia bacterium]|nr:hypothetical protein [Oligoflexia bacterium]